MTVLIVGGGKMGMSHLAIATQYAGKQHVALCDTKLSTRLIFGRIGYRTFRSVDAALKRLGAISGLIVATPTGSHAHLAEWAIDRRIPVFVEKPLTLDVARSAGLASRAKAAGVPAQMGFVLRYVAPFARLRQLAASGVLGKPLGYTARMAGNVITRPDGKSWRNQFAAGGGCLNEYGPHIFDLCRFIFGNVEKVGAVVMTQVHSTLADDRIDLEWTHTDGLQGGVAIDWCDTTKRKSVIEFDVQFTHARITADNSTIRVAFSDAAPLSDAERSDLAAPPAPPPVGFYLRGEEFSLQLEAFISRCAGQPRAGNSSTAADPATLEDGAEVDRLIEAVARKAGLK
jgi:scyllo-inositol 2-dehydrogenase (NADP+)